MPSHFFAVGGYVLHYLWSYLFVPFYAYHSRIVVLAAVVSAGEHCDDVAGLADTVHYWLVASDYDGDVVLGAELRYSVLAETDTLGYWMVTCLFLK